MDNEKAETNYAPGCDPTAKQFKTPELAYQPPKPSGPLPNIGLIGCGGIASYHLEAYQRAGFPVAALCDINESAARSRREEFVLNASVMTDYRELLARDDISVVDIATHPAEREAIVNAAIDAGKHILSQKPFVVDLAVGERQVARAAEKNVKLAVNQNGRGAPHFSYILQAIKAGILGEIDSAMLSVHWDHNWIKGTVFDTIPHVLLFDFGVHWLDILTCFMQDEQPRSVFANVARSPLQEAATPLIGQVLVEYPGCAAAILFNGTTPWTSVDQTIITGSRGAAISSGPTVDSQQVTLHTEEGRARAVLDGTWFTSGFEATMGELLCAIEEDREPSNSAASTLPGLSLMMAAIESAETNKPVSPGTVRRMDPTWLGKQ